MKYLTTLFLALLSFSCNKIKLIRDITKEEVSFNKDQKLKFDVIDNRMISNVKINDKNFRMLVDFAAFSTISDITLIKDFRKTKDNFYPQNHGLSADLQPLKNNILIADSVEAGFLSAKKIPFKVNLTKAPEFCKEQGQDGLLGENLFMQSELPLLLDFEGNTISMIDKIPVGYHLIDSGFPITNRMVIYLKVFGKKEKFIFDTGFSGSILLEKKYQKLMTKYDSINYKGFVFTATNTLIPSERTFYKNVDFELGKLNLKVNPMIADKVNLNLVGTKFLKNFNWIIDYDNKKIYFKDNLTYQKNAEDDLKKMEQEKFKFRAVDNKLICTSKKMTENSLKLGDEIISVNNIKVTPQNICEMQNKLNETQDWDKLNLEIKK